MALGVRRLPFEVPSYSLTGDILSYQRCGLQYRYYNGSSLPPSRPVQIWVGEFIHGVLEEAYRLWRAADPPFPWPNNVTPWPTPPQQPLRVAHDIGELGDRVEARLSARGTRPRSQSARESAYQRAEAAINFLAPHLFPLITAAEERISGTRAMPPLPGGNIGRGDRYELTGVVDVISSVEVARDAGNPIVQVIHGVIPPPAHGYDLIVDYKSMRRPAVNADYWRHHEWQVQTYSWLRAQAPNAQRVGAGLIIYINELSPSQADLEELQNDMRLNHTDVVPPAGSADYYAVHTWQRGHPVPTFTPEFRLRRAIHVIDVSPPNVGAAVANIDGVVVNIEQSAALEFNTGNILANWKACGGERDCVACDFKHFCPSPAEARQPGANWNPQPPVAPG